MLGVKTNKEKCRQQKCLFRIVSGMMDQKRNEMFFLLGYDAV
jgi:hypothetical protein